MQSSVNSTIRFHFGKSAPTIVIIRDVVKYQAKLMCALMLFLSSYAFAQLQELDSILNEPHVTSWGYFRDADLQKWYIANASGAAYALGLNNSQHSSWVTLANGNPVASINFTDKTVTLHSSLFSMTPADSYVAKSLVGGEADQRVYNSLSRNWAQFISGGTLDLDWFFFRIEETGLWYIVWIEDNRTTTLRLELNNALSDYDWQEPKDGPGSGVSVNLENKLEKTFYKDQGEWKVRFSIPSYGYVAPGYLANPNNRGWCYPQCVEFVRENLGLPAGRLYAKYYWTNPHTGYSNYQQGNSTRAPRPGDILVWGGDLNPNLGNGAICDASGCGHVAIVKSVDLVSGRLARVDANWNGRCAVAETEMTITKNQAGNYTISGSGSNHLLGWQSLDAYFE